MSEKHSSNCHKCHKRCNKRYIKEKYIFCKDTYFKKDVNIKGDLNVDGSITFDGCFNPVGKIAGMVNNEEPCYTFDCDATISISDLNFIKDLKSIGDIDDLFAGQTLAGEDCYLDKIGDKPGTINKNTPPQILSLIHI